MSVGPLHRATSIDRGRLFGGLKPLGNPLTAQTLLNRQEDRRENSMADDHLVAYCLLRISPVSCVGIWIFLEKKRYVL